MRQFGLATIILLTMMLIATTAAWLIGGGAQPLDSFPRTFLTDANGRICKQPCIFGIRPSITYYNTSLQILRNRIGSTVYTRRRGLSIWDGEGYHFVITSLDYDSQRVGKTTSMYLDFRKSSYLPNPLYVSMDEITRFFGKPHHIDQQGITRWLYYPAIRLIVEVQIQQSSTPDAINTAQVVRLHFPVKEIYDDAHSVDAENASMQSMK
jgi:hypothetical protein